MAGIDSKASADQPLEEVRTFQRDVLDLLKKYQRDRVVDANTKAYQDDLVKMLKEINKVLTNGKLTTADSDKLAKLMNTTEKAYDNMKTANAGDKAFQKNFVKVFGNKPLEGSLAKMMVEKMGKSIRQFQQMMAQATAPIAKNAKDTALFGVTGPFGAMAEQAVNWQAIRQYIKQGHQNRVANREARRQRTADQYSSNIGALNESLKGIFAGGATDIPDSGSYYLHQGERVVAPEQNKDLSTFLDQVQGRDQHGPTTSSYMKDIDENVKRATKLLEVETATGYFDTLVENNDRLFILGQKDKYRFDKRLFENLEILELGVFQVGRTIYGSFIRFGLGFERFMRHPFFYSADFLTQPFQHMITGLFREFFPKKEDEEERIYDRLGDIYEFMVDKEKKTKTTWGQRFRKRFFETTLGGPINALIKLAGGRAFTLHNAQRIQEEIEKHGHRHGLKGLEDRLHLMGYGKFLNKGAMSEEAKKADEEYKPTGYFRDLRHAFRHPLKAVGGYHILAALGVMNDEDMKRDGIKIKRTLHEKILYIQHKLFLDPLKHAGYVWQRNFVHNAGVLQQNYKRTARENTVYIHRGLFGVPGQGRDARGRFVPHQIGLFGHAKNYMKDIYHTLVGARKDSKKHHKGLFGTLLMFGGFILNGLINVLRSTFGFLKTAAVGGAGMLFGAMGGAAGLAKFASVAFPLILAAAGGYLIGWLLNKLIEGPLSKLIAKIFPSSYNLKNDPIAQKSLALVAERRAQWNLEHPKEAAAARHGIHAASPYVYSAATKAALGLGQAASIEGKGMTAAHRQMVAAENYGPRVMTSAKTQEQQILTQMSDKLTDIHQAIAPVATKVEGVTKAVVKTGSKHINATLQTAKANAPTVEEMLMAKLQSGWNYAYGVYNVFK